MIKMCSVDLALFQKEHFFTYRKFYATTFFQLKWHTDCCMHARWVTEQNFEKKTNVSCSFFSGTLHFNFPLCSARATFDRDFDYFTDAYMYILVMAWMVRARLKTLSSLLKFNLRSGDHFFEGTRERDTREALVGRGRKKERLIQLLHESSAASPPVIRSERLKFKSTNQISTTGQS